MINWLLRWLELPPFAALAPPERLLVILIVAVLWLFVLTMGFAVVVVALRTGHVRRRERRERRVERWQGPIIDLIDGGTPDALHRAVLPGEELALLAVLLGFARRVRGEEARVLSAAAGPYLGAARRGAGARSPERRASAVWALGTFGGEACLEAVIAALDDPSPYVAMNAAQALARPEHARYAQQVMQRLWRFEQWSPEYLSAMLARLGAAVTGPARDILDDRAQPDHARAVAAGVLLQLNDWLAADVAARVLESGDAGEATQAAALRLLGGVGRAEHVAVVRRHLASRHGTVRVQAVRAAAALGGAAEVPGLSAALYDVSPWVAHEAAVGLLQLGRRDIVDDLAARDGAVALIAKQALAERGAA